MWIFPHFQLPLLPLLHLPLGIIIFPYSLQIHILGIIAFIQSRYNRWHQLTAGSLSLRGGLQTRAGLGMGFPISTGFLNLYDTGMLLCCKLSPRTLYFEVSCPIDTLFQNKLSHGHFTSKQTVPSQGGQSTSRGVTLLWSRVSGVDSLFRSKVSGVWFTCPPDTSLRGGKLLCGKAQPWDSSQTLAHSVTVWPNAYIWPLHPGMCNNKIIECYSNAVSIYIPPAGV